MLSHLKWLTLLSLDAPLVAVSWQALIAKSNSSSQHWHHYLIIFSSVWLGYAADRWFDNRKASRPNSEQHIFYHRHGKTVLSIWILVLALAVTLSLNTLTLSEIVRGLALMLASIAYTSFAQKARRLKFYPIAKTASTSLLILAASTLFVDLRSLPLLPLSSIWLLFLSNCLFIRNWSRPNEPHSLTGAIIAGFASLAAGAMSIWIHHLEIGFACILSLFSIAILQIYLKQHQLIVRRALADICLLSPLIFLIR